ncbi:proline--tRNA ligase [Tessaracoccus sp. OH4464_COT-324]|uniref:proline--tRNA ligase n=1 Tax=Tessaracoccus sp. OH4464_COT-324 TaxID=2491059 RepID=UPI000F63B26B|nr:proline--tRNA ligase [Tessaracoccus sp. OH4464_COT-324]RRD47748.1 proline--tRNA ligase [Tessaracoccus sp. OH4464_COT-324]
MISRLSKLFVRTLRDDPADAEVASHKLLVRAGYIRRAAPGIYSWLPLGLKVLQRVEAIVREEMLAMGAQEVHFPALLPSEPYEATGRWSDYGENLFRLKDRKQADMLLGPTHEEMFTLMVKDLYTSYKDLPLSLFQIQTKYRDEARPRAGLLRGREFVMKDSYSFDVHEEGLQASYARHREAYQRIFDRLGFDYVIVSAMAGAMGGSASEEFLAISPIGEDTFVRSPGGYAANVEAVRVAAPEPLPFDDVPAPTLHATPGAASIEDLVDFANTHFPRSDRAWEAADTLKNVVVMLVHPDGKREPLVIGLPGDRVVDDKRLEAAVTPAEIGEFAEADFERHPELVRGYIGPIRDGVAVLGIEGTAKVRYLTDPRVVVGTRWLTGANIADHHVADVVFGRDFTSDGVLDVADVRDGDPAPDGSGPLQLARGIEMGHIFQLGRRYAEALGLKVLDENGKLVTVTMGSYGIGVSRAVAAAAEANHDELGLSWPLELAPYQVQVVATGKEESVFAEAERIAQQLDAAGADVLVDDRKASPGVKFKDAELLGMPFIIVVGRALSEGRVELRNRATGEKREVAVGDIVAETLKLIGR